MRKVSEVAGEDSRNFEAVFEEEKEKWRSKMIKVFGDLYPYKFCLTYGHGLDRPLVEDLVEREPFERLREMTEIDKKAEQEFDEIISSMEDNKDLSYMNQFLEQRKRECVEVFQQFDEIVSLCEKYLELEHKDCNDRMQRQMETQKPMIEDVERYLSEVEEAGDKEISLLKDNIANYLRDMALDWSSKIEKTYEEMNVQPLVMEVFNESTEALTSKEVRDMFLTQQQTAALMWKKAFEDLLFLSSELERYRCEYNVTKSKLERAIYWMNRNYRDNMPELTKTQRQLASFADRRTALFKDLQDLNKDIEKEEKDQRGQKLKSYSKIAAMQLSNKIEHEKSLAKHKKVFAAKKLEVTELLSYVLKGDQCIHEHIINKPWNNVDLKFLESGNEDSENNPEQEQCQKSAEEKKKKIKTLVEDDFAEAYREFICDGEFEILLNYIAEELGCILDFEWVDYAKKTLELEHEIKWIELFRVFKIDFVEDMKSLKSHMKRFSKQKGGEMVFDVNGAIDGFLEFVQMKRNAFESNNSASKNIEQKTYHEFWKAVDNVVPQPALWDSLLDLLEKYRESLQSRRRLLKSRFKLVAENEELDKYLENYYTYDVPKSPQGEQM